jgi:hypothetical protein
MVAPVVLTENDGASVHASERVVNLRTIDFTLVVLPILLGDVVAEDET